MLVHIICGQLFYIIVYIWTGGFIAIWNILSVVCEYTLLHGIYKQYPRLAHKITRPQNTNDIEDQNACAESCQLTSEGYRKSQKEKHSTKEKSSSRSCGRTILLDSFQESFQGWRTYFIHPVR